ncbi:MAG: YkgJ family cysteine cluster protein [Desulfobacterales bacterium]
MEALFKRHYFFDEGIRFACLQCGKCCAGEPGTVYVGNNEIKSISDFLHTPILHVIERYLYPYRDAYSVREDDRGRCLFYENGCRIYPVRPVQCRTFPFWFENLRSELTWRQVEKECPGIGKGTLFSKEEILAILRLSR